MNERHWAPGVLGAVIFLLAIFLFRGRVLFFLPMILLALMWFGLRRGDNSGSNPWEDPDWWKKGKKE
jgi:hypothetical protein